MRGGGGSVCMLYVLVWIGTLVHVGMHSVCLRMCGVSLRSTLGIIPCACPLSVFLRLSFSEPVVYHLG